MYAIQFETDDGPQYFAGPDDAPRLSPYRAEARLWPSADLARAAGLGTPEAPGPAAAIPWPLSIVKLY